VCHIARGGEGRGGGGRPLASAVAASGRRPRGRERRGGGEEVPGKGVFSFFPFFQRERGRQVFLFLP